MADLLGQEVEDFKKKPGLDSTLGKIRTVQKKIKQFQVVKELMDRKMEEMGKGLMTQGQMLLQTLPNDPTRDLPGSDFGENSSEEQTQTPDFNMRY